MRQSHHASILAAAALLVSGLCSGVHGQDSGDTATWSLNGTNTLRSDYYSVHGDEAGSTFAFEGLESYDELSLSLERRKGTYDLWRAQVSGVANDSRYRSGYYGFVPERLNLSHERGDVAMPFRAEAGDVYAYFSYRTLQRSLKGLQLELQPSFGESNTLHSLMLVSGASQPSWRDFRPRDNITNGVSWVIDMESAGILSLNAVRNSRDAVLDDGTLDRTQHVLSLAGEKTLRLGSERLTLEGEFGHFTGDHDGVGGAEEGQDKDDNAVFVQISGRGETPLNYRLRFESYGQNYRPEGAVVTPDRRSGEAHVGWRFTNGLYLRGRLQRFKDAQETDNPLVTKVGGLNLSGPLLGSLADNLTGSVDAFVQDSEDEDNTTNQVTRTVSVNLSKPITELWHGRVGLYYQDQDNQLRDESDTVTKQLNLAADRRLAVLGWEGSISPGVVVRDVHGPNSKDVDVNPTLSLNLRRDNHSLNYSLAYNHQDRRLADTADLETFTHNLDYRYTQGPHTLGVQFTSEHRDPDQDAMSTSGYRVGAFWTCAFGVSSDRRRAHAAAAGAPTVMPAPVAGQQGLALRQFVPDMSLADVRRRLQEARAAVASDSGGILVCETRLLEQIDQRQRLALEHKNGKLTRAALIIELDDTGRPEDVMQTFERVRKAMMDRLGRPTDFFEQGDVSANLFADIRSGRFIRVAEWKTEAGPIRLGMPRRLDGQVRIEIQFARNLPRKTDPLWSVEQVR